MGLLTLGLVIRELAEKGSTLFYSQSTLTRLLKPGGLPAAAQHTAGLDGSGVAAHAHMRVEVRGSVCMHRRFPDTRPLHSLHTAALGGGSNEFAASCNTLMLGCISPISRHLDNTRSTLE